MNVALWIHTLAAKFTYKAHHVILLKDVADMEGMCEGGKYLASASQTRKPLLEFASFTNTSKRKRTASTLRCTLFQKQAVTQW